jgi:Fe-S oxidoreductase
LHLYCCPDLLLEGDIHMGARTPFMEVNQAVVAMGGEDLNSCMQCGMCAGICPWRMVGGEFNVRKMIRMGQLGLEGFESPDVLYGCTTCNYCVQRCPRGVKIIDVMRSMRGMIAEAGTIPQALKTMSGSIFSNGNPWSEVREKRTDWIKEAPVPAFSAGTEYFLSICCTSAYDIRSRKIARAFVDILNKAGVNFGVIGNEESCCGESLRKIGDEGQFETLARKNINLLQSRGVKKIIVTSPHCYYTYTKEYPQLGAEFEVIHHTQLLAEILRKGNLTLSGKADLKVTYHDPCYLGRHSDIYDDPRAIVQALPGVQFVEMTRNRHNSLCCGAGGGRLWMETPPEQRFSDIRLNEALKAGANTLATACPYCISMLEDSRKTLNKDEAIIIKDLAELVAEVM